MRIQVGEAAPAVINHFTAQSLGLPAGAPVPDYVGDPALAAPLIAGLRRRGLVLHEDTERGFWVATIDSPACRHQGISAQVAALRCHLSIACGDFLDLPDELVALQQDHANLWATGPRCAE